MTEPARPEAPFDLNATYTVTLTGHNLHLILVTLNNVGARGVEAQRQVVALHDHLMAAATRKREGEVPKEGQEAPVEEGKAPRRRGRPRGRKGGAGAAPQNE